MHYFPFVAISLGLMYKERPALGVSCAHFWITSTPGPEDTRPPANIYGMPIGLRMCFSSSAASKVGEAMIYLVSGDRDRCDLPGFEDFWRGL